MRAVKNHFTGMHVFAISENICGVITIISQLKLFSYIKNIARSSIKSGNISGKCLNFAWLEKNLTVTNIFFYFQHSHSY